MLNLATATRLVGDASDVPRGGYVYTQHTPIDILATLAYIRDLLPDFVLPKTVQMRVVFFRDFLRYFFLW